MSSNFVSLSRRQNTYHTRGNGLPIQYNPHKARTLGKSRGRNDRTPCNGQGLRLTPDIRSKSRAPCSRRDRIPSRFLRCLDILHNSCTASRCNWCNEGWAHRKGNTPRQPQDARCSSCNDLRYYLVHKRNTRINHCLLWRMPRTMAHLYMHHNHDNDVCCNNRNWYPRYNSHSLHRTLSSIHLYIVL